MKYNTRELFSTIPAALSWLLLACAGIYSSSTMPDINSHRNPFHLSLDDASWFVSLYFLGGIIGALASIACDSRFGRRPKLMFYFAIAAVSWAIITASSSVYVLFLGRILVGVSCGISQTVSGAYVSEISLAKRRGFYLSITMVLYAFGVVLIQTLGYILPWNWVSVVCVAICIPGSILVLFIPETPHYLAMKGNYEEAERSLRWLRRSKDVSNELSEIKAKIEASKLTRTTLAELWHLGILKGALIILILLAFHDFSGALLMKMYSVTIFENVSKGFLNSYVQGIITSTSSVVGHFIMAVAVDRIGRRPLYITTYVMMAASMIGIGTYEKLTTDSDTNSSLSYLPLIFLFTFNIGASLGAASFPIVFMNELFPTRYRMFGTTVGAIGSGVFGFITSDLFLILTNSFGYSGTFFFFASISIIAVIFISLVIPETKGKTLEETEGWIKSNNCCCFTRIGH